MTESSEKKRKTRADGEEEQDDAIASLKTRNEELKDNNAYLQLRLTRLTESAKIRADNAALEERNEELLEKIVLLEKGAAAVDTVVAASVLPTDDEAEAGVVTKKQPVRRALQPAFEARVTVMRCNTCGCEISGPTRSDNWDGTRGKHVSTMVQLCYRCERGSVKMF